MLVTAWQKDSVMLKIKDHPGILLKKVARLFEQVANKKLSNLGITHAQTVILIRLWETDGLSQAELTKSAGLDQSTVVRLLNRMEKDNLITRIQNTDDRRIYNFYLTEKAKKACRKLEKNSYEITSLAHESLLPKDLEKFNRILSVVEKNLEQFLKKI